MGVINLDPSMAALTLSGVLALTAALMYLIYIALSRRAPTSSVEYGEAYIGGESRTVIKSLDISVRNLFWGIIWGAGRRLYLILRDRIHNGMMNDWSVYMITYIGFLSLIALVYFLALRWVAWT